jgi:hypothetical protein
VQFQYGRTHVEDNVITDNGCSVDMCSSFVKLRQGQVSFTGASTANFPKNPSSPAGIT